jgi:UbiD family decarboxylase
MAYDDLRSFLDTLDKKGQLLRITEELNPEPDLAAAANAVSRLGDTAPALFFNNVKGFTSARIAMNVHGSWANHALALGLPKDTGTKGAGGRIHRPLGEVPRQARMARQPSLGGEQPGGRRRQHLRGAAPVPSQRR